MILLLTKTGGSAESRQFESGVFIQKLGSTCEKKKKKEKNSFASSPPPKKRKKVFADKE